MMAHSDRRISGKNAVPMNTTVNKTNSGWSTTVYWSALGTAKLTYKPSKWLR